MSALAVAGIAFVAGLAGGLAFVPSVFVAIEVMNRWADRRKRKR